MRCQNNVLGLVGGNLLPRLVSAHKVPDRSLLYCAACRFNRNGHLKFHMQRLHGSEEKEIPDPAPGSTSQTIVLSSEEEALATLQSEPLLGLLACCRGAWPRSCLLGSVELTEAKS